MLNFQLLTVKMEHQCQLAEDPLLITVLPTMCTSVPLQSLTYIPSAGQAIHGHILVLGFVQGWHTIRAHTLFSGHSSASVRTEMKNRAAVRRGLFPAVPVFFAFCGEIKKRPLCTAPENVPEQICIWAQKKKSKQEKHYTLAKKQPETVKNGVSLNCNAQPIH